MKKKVKEYFFIKLGGLTPNCTARQPPLAGAAPLAIYTRQVPVAPCEY